MSTFRKPIVVFVSLFTISFVGCASDSDTDSSNVETSAPPETVGPHAGHAHPTHGPHQGDLIELGNEEYHAELLHEEDSVTIYILNGAADCFIQLNSLLIFQLSAQAVNRRAIGRNRQVRVRFL